MKYKIVTKGVSFNVLDPDQEKLLQHAIKRKNFSSYIKRLIQRDIDNSFIPVQNHGASIEKNEEINDDFMKDLI